MNIPQTIKQIPVGSVTGLIKAMWAIVLALMLANSYSGYAQAQDRALRDVSAASPASTSGRPSLVSAGTTPAFCPSVCKNGMTSVYAPTPQGCQLHFTVACFPGKCGKDSRTCNVQCNTSKDCGPNAACTTDGQCAPAIAICSDATTVQEADGSLTTCNPYSCLAGHCRSTCVSSADCTSGYVCNKPTSMCVPK